MTAKQKHIPDILFPARFSPERLLAWRWRVANLGSLVLNHHFAATKSLALMNNVPEGLSRNSARIANDLEIIKNGLYVPSIHGNDFTMHVGKSSRKTLMLARDAVEGGTFQIDDGRIADSLGLQGLNPKLADSLVVTGLMHEVPTQPSELGTNFTSDQNHSIQQPYLLAWADKGTQSLVRDGSRR